MAALVETMFSVRETPWHGLGEIIQEAPTSADALRIAGLDWTVESKPIQVCGGKKIPDYSANVRSKDGAVLGVVGGRYKIVQNSEAFAFTDSIIGGEVRYETAGSLNGGRRVWMLAKMEGHTIGGDEVEPYLCFTNTHDGSGAVKAIMTPIRVVCNNTLNAALSSAKRSWSMRHTNNIDKRLEEAKEVLGLAQNYMVELADYAEVAIKTKLSDPELEYILNGIFKVDPNAKNKELQEQRAKANKEAFYVCYAAPDIAKFQGTAWGAINAMSDLVGHSLPHKNTQNYDENNWGRIMDGHPLFDKMVNLIGVA